MHSLFVAELLRVQRDLITKRERYSQRRDAERSSELNPIKALQTLAVRKSPNHERTPHSAG
jgi:hypothetical protein